ncbi:MAG TPA: hypothetical protein VFG94_04120, partial [Acidimicrobiales bacterium]|nr:hypothetical protein [Acidimicrobiales bacterium]
TRMSPVQMVSIVCSNVGGPRGVSSSRPAIPGSSSAAWIAPLTVSQAPTGSSSGDLAHHHLTWLARIRPR